MCYRSAYYNSREQKITLLTWDQNGNRVKTEHSYDPYLYVEGPGDYESIFGTRLSKRRFRNQWERNNFVREVGIKRIFENFSPVQQFLLDSFWEINETADFAKNDLKIAFIDIEVVADEFPDAKEAKYPINVITVYDSIDKKFYTWGCRDYVAKEADVVYVKCKSESELIQKFMNYIRDDYPDIISGWNSMGFDIPYIMNRISRVFGDEIRHTMSPSGNTFYRDIHNELGQDLQRWFIEGVALIDYLEVYKRFSPGEKESFKLNSIAQLELGESKIDLGVTNFVDLMKNDWDKFVSYNIQDVRLLKGIDAKLRFLNLIRMFAYIGLTTFEGAMGSISVINGAAAIRARQRGQRLPTFVRDVDSKKNPGAFVGEPLQGFQKNIVSFDANSLYPNVMISLNMSPETKIGKITSREDGKVTIHHANGKFFTIDEDKLPLLIEKEKLAISKADVLFTQKKKGIFPEVLDFYYNKRVETREILKNVKLKLKELEDQIEETKRQLNSDTAV